MYITYLIILVSNKRKCSLVSNYWYTVLCKLARLILWKSVKKHGLTLLLLLLSSTCVFHYVNFIGVLASALPLFP